MPVTMSWTAVREMTGLYGGTGINTLEGGAGADVLRGLEGVPFTDFDIASYASSDAGVVVLLEYNVAAGGHAAGDTLFGIEGVIGSEHGDVLFGDSGGNLLIGNAGDDVLVSRGNNHSTPRNDLFIGGTGC